MKRWVLFIVFSLAALGCKKGPCANLKEQVCEKAPSTPACERASRATNPDECREFLMEVDKFIELANMKVDAPVLKPPKKALAPEDVIPGPKATPDASSPDGGQNPPVEQ